MFSVGPLPVLPRQSDRNHDRCEHTRPQQEGGSWMRSSVDDSENQHHERNPVSSFTPFHPPSCEGHKHLLNRRTRDASITRRQHTPFAFSVYSLTVQAIFFAVVLSIFLGSSGKPVTAHAILSAKSGAREPLLLIAPYAHSPRRLSKFLRAL